MRAHADQTERHLRSCEGQKSKLDKILVLYQNSSIRYEFGAYRPYKITKCSIFFVSIKFEIFNFSKLLKFQVYSCSSRSSRPRSNNQVARSMVVRPLETCQIRGRHLSTLTNENCPSKWIWHFTRQFIILNNNQKFKLFQFDSMSESFKI